jgi:uncharacterized protein YkwD/LysM repeat protein
MRKLMPAFLILLMTLLVSVSRSPAHAESVALPQFSSAAELINAVNALRASNGLPPYSPNSILMGIAQNQAEYSLSLGYGSHISADGLRPYQRALQAGYPVAGDLSIGGLFAENITMGIGMTAEDAVNNWTGDFLHLDTMLSTNLQDIGAGVAVSGDIYYYVIDCGLSTGGTPVPFTPQSTYISPRTTITQNTPNADGSITYIVQLGDTPGGIAEAYGMNSSTLFALNGLPAKSIIYPNQKLIVRAAYTPTSTQPTGTPTERFTITPWPTSTPTATRTSFPPTSTPSPGLPISTAKKTVTTIIVVTLIAAGLLALLGRKRDQ